MNPVISAGRPLALTIVMVLLAGCSLRQSPRPYRLSQMESESFLLSPDATTVANADHQVLRVPRSGVGFHGTECSIRDPWFSFSADERSKSWIAETPSALAWSRSQGSLDMKDEWQKFERALLQLKQTGCFASVDEYRTAKQRIAASLSAPVSDSLFYRYGYGPEGYVDMAPGMQLRIERDFFAANANDRSRPEDYRGTTISYYEVVGDTHLKFLRVEKKSAAQVSLEKDLPDAMLASQFANTAHLRLFLQDLVVAGGAKSPAMLIGAAVENDLTAATRAVEDDPAASCTTLLQWQVTCARFDGHVTVSPMLKVFVNGAVTYVPIGSRLWAVFPGGSLPAMLRISRQFAGRNVQVEFPPNFEVVSQLLLFAGDRVSWRVK